MASAVIPNGAEAQLSRQKAHWGTAVCENPEKAEIAELESTSANPTASRQSAGGNWTTCWPQIARWLGEGEATPPREAAPGQN
jgi:hypothetical protein